MTDEASNIAARLGRVREYMDERGFDAMLVRDEASLRWLTAAAGVFDFSFEFPHAAFITASESYLHTDSRYYNTFCEKLPSGHPWQLDEEAVEIPQWVVLRAQDARCRTVAVEDDVQLSFYRALERSAQEQALDLAFPTYQGDIRLMRAQKDAGELELMRRAQAITDAGFQHMLGFIRPGLTEKQIKVELESYLLTYGADGLAFATIVASGPNSANPHAVPSDRVVEKGDFVLMDYGARYRDYCSDMTRTVVLGAPSAQQEEIYALVRRANEACEAAVYAGVDGRDIHELSRTIIAEGGYGGCYNHGLGHGVGIDIHELPNFGRRSNIVGEGSVITVEPGVYLPGVGGVRLEDCGVVTREGYEPFTASPHDLHVIDC